jgi:hypothetical protein
LIRICLEVNDQRLAALPIEQVLLVPGGGC